jgi:hypothetical protein
VTAESLHFGSVGGPDRGALKAEGCLAGYADKSRQQRSEPLTSLPPTQPMSAPSTPQRGLVHYEEAPHTPDRPYMSPPRVRMVNGRQEQSPPPLRYKAGQPARTFDAVLAAVLPRALVFGPESE